MNNRLTASPKTPDALELSDAQGQMALKEKTIYGNRLLIWRNVQMDQPVATNLWAILPSGEWSGKQTELYDWKADFGAGTIYVRAGIYLGSGQYLQVEDTYPFQKEEQRLKPPSRNFEWSSFGGYWRNLKTGERRRAA